MSDEVTQNAENQTGDLEFSNQIASLVSGAAFLVLTLVAIAVFLNVFSPRPYQKPVEPFENYDASAMLAALKPDKVAGHAEKILGFGSRYTGQDGFYAVEDYLRTQFTGAGLEIWEQNITSAAVQTERAQLSVDGVVHDTKIYPFLPNHIQPMNTPPGGLSGKLVLLTDEVMQSSTSFDNCIGLLDASEKAPRTYGYDWVKYAQLGITALVVAHPEGIEAIDWRKLPAIVTHQNPVNYVRVAASQEIFELLGETITLDVRTSFRPVPTTTLVARLRAGNQANEAILVPVSYDAGSLLPDVALSASQALPPAMQLSLLEGLATYKDELRRDVFFICFGAHTMAQDAQNRLLAALGQKTNIEGRANELLRNKQEHEAALRKIERLIELFNDEEFFVIPDATVEQLREIGRDADLFEKQSTFVRNQIVFELSEERLQAKILFDKNPKDEEIARHFRRVNTKYNKAFSASGHNIGKLLKEEGDYLEEHNVRERLRNRLVELADYHRNELRLSEQQIELNKLFGTYNNLIVLSPELAARPADENGPAPEVMSFSMGYDARYNTEHPVLIRNHMMNAAERIGFADKVTVTNTGNWHGQAIASQTSRVPLESRLWLRFSYPAFSIVNADRGASYQAWFDPVGPDYARKAEGMEYSLAVLGEVVLSAAFGNGRFPNVTTQEVIHNFNGNVFASNVGQSIIPNHPVPGALLSTKSYIEPLLPGYFLQLFFYTNPYGSYRYTYCATDFGHMWIYSPDAALYGEDGVISHIKDCGTSAQSVYKSMNLGGAQLSNPVNLALYRATPVTLFDMINPQTLRAFAGVSFLRSRGLVEFENSNMFTSGGITTAFIKPDETFFVTFKAGSAENELSQTIRAFMLGVRAEEIGAPVSREPGREIVGPGYLAQDNPRLLDVPRQIAHSMIDLNASRLHMQNRGGHQMADERTVAFHDQSVSLLVHAEEDDIPLHDVLLQSRDAATYAIQNHPQLRQNINEAIFGIVWYLGLLVPFVFFFEKLVFGYADIRKQLAAISIIFLTVFLLLWLLHPAFSMIRSSVMVLLGFVIMLISVGITVLFSSKFQENLEEIRKRRGRVTAAEANKLGVLATAFLLGLNNMHRRRVRTWLTCATLILMTFVMICFTSVQSDLVDTQVAVGKAPFTGFVVKNELFQPVVPAEVFALTGKYGHMADICPRHMLVGTEDYNTKQRFNPDVRVAYTPAESLPREAALNSVVRFAPAEPLAREIRLLTDNGWFTEEQSLAEEGLIPVMISAAAARELAITPEMVNGGGMVVSVNENDVLLYGIFEAESLRIIQDLDGNDVLPFDITALRDLNVGSGGGIIVEENDPRIAADRILLAPTGRWNISIARSKQIIHSLAIVFPEDYGYRESKQLIDRYLEQTGRATYYGLDGMSFLGRRARTRTVEGLVEMLIPLVIAALTVLNTMKGSVYERRDEIFVYNSVGIAPKHIFFIFFSEASVYAVVGSVMGYLLSQGTGRVLTALDFTGGLNMTFASSSTIYASLAIAASVFVSTYFPARTAMRIATPTDDLGWRLPEAGTDVWQFTAPFTFSFRDRIAILSFFSRYFEDHGEGGAGTFFANQPKLGVEEKPKPGSEGGSADELVPKLTVSIWPKPFDLGVSQVLTVSMGTDPETGEYIPTINLERLSGTRENWTRLNKRFITLIRERLLHWRAVGEAQRQEMFEEAKEQMQSSISVSE